MKEFAGNFIKLFSGNLGAQVIVVASAPLITRLYDPDAFGVAAVFMALVALLSPLMGLTYSGAVPLPKEDRVAHNLMAVCFVLILIAGALLSLVLALFPGILDLVGRSSVKQFAWILPALLVLEGITAALFTWNLRRKHYNSLAGSKVAGAVTEQGGRIGSGLFGAASAGALIATGVAGRLVSTVWLAIRWWGRDGRTFCSSLSFAAMRSAMIRYKRFPQFSVWTAFCNSISRQFPYLLLARYFGDGVVGFYALGAAVLGRPVLVIGNSLNQAFYQEAAVMIREGRPLRPLVARLLRTGMALFSLPFILLAFFGGPLFALLFGATWFDAGLYAQVLAPLFLMVLMFRQVASLMPAMERQDMALKFQVILMIARLISLLAGCASGRVLVALGAYSVSSCLVFSWGMWWVAGKAGVRSRELLSWAGLYFGYALLCALAGWWISLMLPGRVLPLLTGGAVAALAYYLVLLRFDRTLQQPLQFLLERFQKRPDPIQPDPEA